MYCVVSVCIVLYIPFLTFFLPFYKLFSSFQFYDDAIFCCCCYSLCTGSSLFPDFSFPQSLNGFPSSYADSLETPPPQRSSILMSVFSYPALLPVTIYSLILSSKQSDQIRSDQLLSRVLLKAVRTN